MLYSMYDIVCFFSTLAVGLTPSFCGFLLLLFLANEMLTLFCILYVHQKIQITSSTLTMRVSGSENYTLLGVIEKNQLHKSFQGKLVSSCSCGIIFDDI